MYVCMYVVCIPDYHFADTILADGDSSGTKIYVTVCKALEDVMQSVAAIQSELNVDRVDICTMTELDLD